MLIFSTKKKFQMTSLYYHQCHCICIIFAIIHPVSIGNSFLTMNRTPYQAPIIQYMNRSETLEPFIWDSHHRLKVKLCYAVLQKVQSPIKIVYGLQLSLSLSLTVPSLLLNRQSKTKQKIMASQNSSYFVFTFPRLNDWNNRKKEPAAQWLMKRFVICSPN